MVKYTFIALLLLSNLILSQEATARFLLHKPSAQAMALAGTGVAKSNAGFSMFYNPATMTKVKGFALSGSYFNPNAIFNSTVHSYVGIVANLGEYGAVGAEMNMNWQGSHIYTSEIGDNLGIFEEYLFNYQASIGYAYDVHENLSLGLKLGLLQYEVASSEMTVGNEVGNLNPDLMFTAGLGVYYGELFQDFTIDICHAGIDNPLSGIAIQKDMRGLSFGLSLGNYGSDVTFIDKEQASPLPSVLLAGMNYVVINNKLISLTVATDMEMHTNEDSIMKYWRHGMELNVFHCVPLRIGYVNGVGDGFPSFMTYGLGLNTLYGGFNVAYYEKTIQPTWIYDLQLRLEL
jgi:hypothetical protein